MKYSVRLVRLIVGLLALAAGGCGGTGAVPVSGLVTYQGEPLADVTIIFTPAGGGAEGAAGKIATGQTDSQGKFTVTTESPGDGAVPGEYTVSILPNTPVPAPDSDEYDYSMPPPAPFPEKYMGAASTPFKVTVTKGEEKNFPLEMTNSAPAADGPPL